MALLKRHNNKLPKRYACSDTRHQWKYQKRRKWKLFGSRKWHCRHVGCPKTKDATLARFAILNFLIPTKGPRLVEGRRHGIYTYMGVCAALAP